MDRDKCLPEEHTNEAFVADRPSATTSRAAKSSPNGVKSNTSTSGNPTDAPLRHQRDVSVPTTRPPPVRPRPRPPPPQPRPQTTALFTANRKNSLAGVAMAVRPSLSTPDLSNVDPIIVHVRRQQYKYVHPFGNARTLLEDLLWCEEMEEPGGDKASSGSTAKLLIWLVFCFFMVGVAGAIILGAESYKKSEATTVPVNVSLIQTTMAPENA